MVRITFNQPEGVHTPFSHYSHSVEVENPRKFVFCAGQVAGDESGNILGPDDFEAQGELVMVNIRKVLNRSGADLKDVEWGEGASREHFDLCRCGQSKNKPFCNGAHWHHHFDEHAPKPGA